MGNKHRENNIFCLRKASNGSNGKEMVLRCTYLKATKCFCYLWYFWNNRWMSTFLMRSFLKQFWCLKCPSRLQAGKYKPELCGVCLYLYKNKSILNLLYHWLFHRGNKWLFGIDSWGELWSAFYLSGKIWDDWLHY